MKSDVLDIDQAPIYSNADIHIGGIYEAVLNEFLFKVLKTGHNVNLKKGLDNNGLPIYLEAKKTPNLKDYRAKCIELLKENTGKIKESYKKLNFNPELYFTDDLFFTKLSQDIFYKFYKNKIIKKTELPTNYCTACKTNLSNSECTFIEIPTKEYAICFEVEGQTYNFLTTKPEYLPTIKGIYFNPKDDRYKHLLNKKATIKLKNFIIETTVKESPHICIKKGSGLCYVGCCSSHNDLKILKENEVIDYVQSSLYSDVNTLNDRLKHPIIEQFRKTNRKDYESWFLEYFNLIALDSPESKKLIHSERSNCKAEVILLPTLTYVIELQKYKKQVLEELANIKFNNPSALYDLKNYLENLSYWSITRNQNYYGISVEVDSKQLYLDTWFTSALTCHTTPNPNYRIQGTDIMRSWLIYSIVMKILLSKIGYETTGLKYVFLHRMLVDKNGIKISKSLGNNPIDIKKYSDSEILALKLYFLHLDPLKELRIDQTRLKVYEKAIIKVRSCLNYFLTNHPELVALKANDLEPWLKVLRDEMLNKVKLKLNITEIYDVSKKLKNIKGEKELTELHGKVCFFNYLLDLLK